MKNLLSSKIINIYKIKTTITSMKGINSELLFFMLPELSIEKSYPVKKGLEFSL